MSQVADWKAIKVFNEKREFTVAPSHMDTAPQ